MSKEEYGKGFPDNWDEDHNEWYYVFDVASRDTKGAKVGLDDVKHVDRWCEGENEESEWLMVGRLKDDRWFFVASGCDFTGWGCQDWGRIYFAKRRYQLLDLHVMAEELQRLGYPTDGSGHE